MTTISTINQTKQNLNKGNKNRARRSGPIFTEIIYLFHFCKNYVVIYTKCTLITRIGANIALVHILILLHFYEKPYAKLSVWQRWTLVNIGHVLRFSSDDLPHFIHISFKYILSLFLLSNIVCKRCSFRCI